MTDYMSLINFDDSVSLTFCIENEKIMTIGEELEKINGNAYMNGYN